MKYLTINLIKFLSILVMKRENLGVFVFGTVVGAAVAHHELDVAIELLQTAVLVRHQLALNLREVHRVLDLLGVAGQDGIVQLIK